MVIGSEEEARAVVGVAAVVGEYGEPGPCGNGWTFLGAGAYRQAFLSPTGTVYKVAKYYPEENENEHRACTRIRQNVKQDLVYVPETSLYGQVLAMEYVDGSPALWSEMSKAEGHTVMDVLGIRDCHSGNVRRMRDGKLAVIDYNISFHGNEDPI